MTKEASSLISPQFEASDVEPRLILSGPFKYHHLCHQHRSVEAFRFCRFTAQWYLDMQVPNEAQISPGWMAQECPSMAFLVSNVQVHSLSPESSKSFSKFLTILPNIVNDI